MYLPETYIVALIFMLLSMICWGSWANTMKAAKGFPFQLFYWDYVIGVVGGSVLWGVTLGSVLGGHSSFTANLKQADTIHILYGLGGGIVFNVANLLLVAAVEIAGLAVAFPVGIGLALVEGCLINYALLPKGNPLLLFGGVFLVLCAILLDAAAYKLRENTSRNASQKGIFLSLASGILMGLFYPFVVKGTQGDHSLGPYTGAFIFSLGVVLCSIPVNYALMIKPLSGGPRVCLSEYWRGKSSWHIWGVVGGVIWCSGAVLNFAASQARLVGPTVSYAIGQGGTMVTAVWGVFVWHEFQGAPPKAKRLLVLMFFCFIAGLAFVACAPLFH